MKNEPVGHFYPEGEGVTIYDIKFAWKVTGTTEPIPLYTHPAKELHLSLQKSKETGELLAVTYTDDEHRIVEVLWKKPPAKTLTDEEIDSLADEFGAGMEQFGGCFRHVDFARAIEMIYRDIEELKIWGNDNGMRFHRDPDDKTKYKVYFTDDDIDKLESFVRQQQAEIEALKDGIEKLKDAYCQKDHEVKKAEQYCLDAFDRGRQIGYADGMISRKAQEK